MQRRADVVVVGAGILGLAHALAAARRGRSVVVLERDERAWGASVRNFGMVWPIGVPSGELTPAAHFSRATWLDFARQAGFWASPCGSVHLAYEEDELAVMREFVAREGAQRDCRVLGADAASEHCPRARPGLLGALRSEAEVAVDPREALPALARHLATSLGVRFCFGSAARQVEPGVVHAGAGRFEASTIIVCGNADLRALFPDLLASAGVARCKLQMMRTAPQPGGWRLGTHVAGGLSLRHYRSFAGCPSVAALRDRVSAQRPHLDRFGIHLLASQNHAGEVVIGDSHEYGDEVTPFDSEAINSMILDELNRLIDLPDPTVASRWHGVYTRHPTLPHLAARPLDGVIAHTITNGLGMTLSFGLAEQLHAGG